MPTPSGPLRTAATSSMRSSPDAFTTTSTRPAEATTPPTLTWPSAVGCRQPRRCWRSGGLSRASPRPEAAGLLARARGEAEGGGHHPEHARVVHVAAEQLRAGAHGDEHDVVRRMHALPLGEGQVALHARSLRGNRRPRWPPPAHPSPRPV